MAIPLEVLRKDVDGFRGTFSLDDDGDLVYLADDCARNECDCSEGECRHDIAQLFYDGETAAAIVRLLNAPRELIAKIDELDHRDAEIIETRARLRREQDARADLRIELDRVIRERDEARALAEVRRHV